MLIMAWPDNDWCYEDELLDLLHYKSDDYITFTFPDEVDEAAIDRIIAAINSDRTAYFLMRPDL